ncbi:hypothetical protein TIFTF001_054454 [Ficus carica]|uniref:Uncharacterized protein n=1 Tax=Ficus carica TaxID=3494 RepID=A0AA88EH05_FICCA|nr:hypothetical protein TIFTF001_054454 [Ficus carica]
MIAMASAMTTTKGRPDPGSLLIGVVISGTGENVG